MSVAGVRKMVDLEMRQLRPLAQPKRVGNVLLCGETCEEGPRREAKPDGEATLRDKHLNEQFGGG